MSGILEALMKGGQTMLSGAENLGSDALTGAENLGSTFLQNTGLMSPDINQAIARGGVTPGGFNAGANMDPQVLQQIKQQQMQQMMRKMMLSQMMGQLGGGRQQGGIGSQLPMLLMMLNQGGGYGTP